MLFYIDIFLQEVDKIINKEKVFQKELGWIQDDNIRRFAKKAVALMPYYLFDVADSSSGKYHPKYALGSGGLVRHTKAAVQIAHDLLALEQNQTKFAEQARDCFLTALMLHDGWKHGSDGKSHTVAEHPSVAATWVKSASELDGLLSEELRCFIGDLIASHMGQWNADFRSKKEILPKPLTEGQQFVHLCDYLASRKYLLFDFENEYYEPERFRVNDLEKRIAEILTVCKSKVSEAPEKRDRLYAVIADNNEGRRNPNSIRDMETANRVLECVKEV